jgi:hypothetical protein
MRYIVGSSHGRVKPKTIKCCCFSAKHATLRKKSKDGLAWNQDNVSEWGDMSIRGLLFQWPLYLSRQHYRRIVSSGEDSNRRILPKFNNHNNIGLTILSNKSNKHPIVILYNFPLLIISYKHVAFVPFNTFFFVNLKVLFIVKVTSK